MKTILYFLAAFALGTSLAGAQGAALRVGDTVDIRLSGVPSDEVSTFNAAYTVDDHGNINLPFLKEVKVVGLLPNEVENMIQNQLVEQKIYTHPIVAVLQNQPRFVNFLGEVRAPQRVGYTADMTLMTGITACGGFTDFADQKHVRLIRDGKTTTYDIRQLRKDPTLDPKLVPGDQITVPQSWF